MSLMKWFCHCKWIKNCRREIAIIWRPMLYFWSKCICSWIKQFTVSHVILQQTLISLLTFGFSQLIVLYKAGRALERVSCCVFFFFVCSSWYNKNVNRNKAEELLRKEVRLSLLSPVLCLYSLPVHTYSYDTFFIMSVMCLSILSSRFRDSDISDSILLKDICS